MTDNQDSLTGRLRAPHESSNLHSSLCRVWGAWALSTLCIIRMTRSGPYRLPYPYLSIPNLYISAPTLIQHSAITNVINLLSPLPLLANGGADDRADRPRRPDRDVRRFLSRLRAENASSSASCGCLTMAAHSLPVLAAWWHCGHHELLLRAFCWSMLLATLRC